MTVDIERYLSELELLVNMDSGFGNPDGITAIAEWFKRRFDALGWITGLHDVGSQTGRVLVAKNREAARYDALLVGHLDTVFPAGETAKRPFRRDTERAYGVGVIDMKQGDLAILHILEQLPEQVNERLNIAVILNPDEETGSNCSKALIDSYARISDYAYVFEAASTDGSHCVQRKGSYSAHVQFHGKAGHAGFMLEGGMISAINELLLWGTELNRHISKETGTSVNIGIINGGQAVNIVPDFAEMKFEARYEKTEECESFIKTVERLKMHAAEAGVKAEFIREKRTLPMYPSERVLAYVEHIRKLSEKSGIPFKHKGRGGLSDANHISACGPICVDGLAPTGDFDHSEREYLEISTIEPNLRFAWLLLCDLAELKSSGRSFR